MKPPVRVLVDATNKISSAGVVEILEGLSGFEVVAEPADADVVVVLVDRVDVGTPARLRRWASSTTGPLVLVAGDLGGLDLLTAVSCRVSGVMSRAGVTAERLGEVLRTVAANGAVVPPALLGDLLRQVARLHQEVLAPNGLTGTGLTSRETDVLRLVAEGFDTAEIAEELNYSERSVKHVLHGMTTRLGLRSRAHAVAHALREGMI
ncbi:response regulator transcription factor [Umezawaea sp. NPDC059074]|uniref:helix-turn-helix transcriptional regulator n=1 Tax=Umezawaea sp. NPDC059074 TaxID=3346716 RepID=UPI003698ED9F